MRYDIRLQSASARIAVSFSLSLLAASLISRVDPCQIKNLFAFCDSIPIPAGREFRPPCLLGPLPARSAFRCADSAGAPLLFAGTHRRAAAGAGARGPRRALRAGPRRRRGSDARPAAGQQDGLRPRGAAGAAGRGLGHRTRPVSESGGAGARSSVVWGTIGAGAERPFDPPPPQRRAVRGVGGRGQGMCFETSRRGTVGGTASWRDNGRARESTGSLEAGRCVRPGKRIAQRGRHTAAVAHKRERRTQTLRPRQPRLRTAAARAGGPPAQASGNSFSVLLYLHSHGPRAGQSLLIESRGYSGNHRAAQPTVAGELV